VLSRARYDREAALNIDHTSASNSDRLVTQQAIGRFENLPRIPWSGLLADMISNPVNQGCQFTALAFLRVSGQTNARIEADALPM
jgi:hypothetical protein